MFHPNHAFVFDDTFGDNSDFHLKKSTVFLTTKANKGMQLLGILGSSGRKDPVR